MPPSAAADKARHPPKRVAADCGRTARTMAECCDKGTIVFFHHAPFAADGKRGGVLVGSGGAARRLPPFRPRLFDLRVEAGVLSAKTRFRPSN